MVAILIKSDLRNKSHDEIKEIFITATDPDRSKTMKGYENKEQTNSPQKGGVNQNEQTK